MNSHERNNKTELKSFSGYYLQNISNKNDKLVILTFDEIQQIMKFLKFKRKDIAALFQISESTVTRWKSKNATIGAKLSGNIVDIDKVIDKGVRLFGSEENFKEWLNRYNYVLGNKKPNDLIKTPEGTEKVNKVIEAISWGNFV